MTALTEYQRLECLGLWRETPENQRRDVVVTFGDATLIIRESPSDRALAHWSLPAVTRTNPGRMPALYSPGPDSGEELEIDDDMMIAAITKVHAIIAARQPHPGRLRGALVMALLAGMAAASLLWLPGAIIGHATRVLPDAARTDIGEAILADLERVTGRPCAAADGKTVLDEFQERLMDPGGRLMVLPEGLAGAVHMPGDIIAIGRPLIEGHDTPEVAAGYILAERGRAAEHDPLYDALHYAGLRATFQLLTTGNVPDGAFRGYGERLIKTAPPPLDQDRLLKSFENAGVGSTAYAYAVDKTGETTLRLIEADPFARTPPPLPLLNDTDWVALQGICSG